MVIRQLGDPHDVLNLWSPICNPSGWANVGAQARRLGSMGSGMNAFGSSPIGSY